MLVSIITFLIYVCVLALVIYHHHLGFARCRRVADSGQGHPDPLGHRRAYRDSVAGADGARRWWVSNTRHPMR
jgi:hypothetical protein